jgi:hypothetical protein
MIKNKIKIQSQFIYISKKILVILILIFQKYEVLLAQFEIVPNQNFYIQKQNHKPTLKTPPILQLPFFDDFSNYQGKADTTIWQPQGGTFINQSYAHAPISLGVATFDGLNEKGQPYNFSTPTFDAVGLSDQLTTHAIDLSNLSVADSLYLSFYYQRKGRGELPDINDSLRVQFKRNDNTWITVWKVTGGQSDISFKPVSLPLQNTNYFFNGFQFRIQAFGRLSGMYDVWNVDYVYLDKNRRLNNLNVEEITASKNFKGILKRYTSMPVKHFWADIANNTSPLIESTMNNLSGSGFDVVSYTCEVYDTLTSPPTFMGTIGSTTPFVLSGTAQQFVMSGSVPSNFFPTSPQKLGLKTQFSINSGDNNTTIQGIDLRRNDTIKAFNNITDFFAYDDGTPEYGAGINQRFGKVAVRFNLSQPDTLTDIKIHFTKFEKDLSTQTFNLIIWRWIADGSQVKDSILYKVNVPIRYPTQRNDLLSVQSMKRTTQNNFFFPKIALPAGDFLIGWEQTTNDRVTVGYDLNNDSTPYIWFNAGNQWLNFQPADDEKGSLLIRPIFSKDVITSYNEIDFSTQWQLFPNPAQDKITLKGKLPDKVIIIDALGKIYFEKNIENSITSQTINVSNLKDGLYFVKGFFGKEKTSIKKLLVQNK